MEESRGLCFTAEVMLTWGVPHSAQRKFIFTQKKLEVGAHADALRLLPLSISTPHPAVTHDTSTAPLVCSAILRASAAGSVAVDK